jgi:hypothetical protein
MITEAYLEQTLRRIADFRGNHDASPCAAPRITMREEPAPQHPLNET